MPVRRRAAYRVGQAFSMLRGGMSDADRAEVRETLPENLAECFFRMSERDQRHAVRVLRRARHAVTDGVDAATLWQAALLHDVGKAETELGIPGRSLVVVAGATHLVAALRHTPGLGRRVATYLEHPRIGARMLRAAGADPRLVAVVAEHQDRNPVRPETRVLQEIDGRE